MLARWLLAALPLIAGCSKDRLPECEGYLASVEKLSRCESLPAVDRAAYKAAAEQTRRMLQNLNGSGNKDARGEMRSVCRAMNERVKAFPECL